MTARPNLRIVVIAPLRFPIRRPHAGGLESAVWNEVHQLRARGHEVTLIAPEGSDGAAITIPALTWPAGSRPTDDSYPPSYLDRSVPALDRALDVIAETPEHFDVISNHCLHGLPLQRAGELGVPMVSTLHTPVDDDLVHAHASATGYRSSFLSVSEFTRREWAAAGVTSSVLPNAVDPIAWPLGPGGSDLVWFGRIVPEKAPHLAIEVAERLGRRLIIAGRIGDADYAERFVLPRVGAGVRYIGQLAPHELAALVGRSACSIATPVWDEPFGLVAPEALMCGTPVASFAVGGVAEIAGASLGMATAPRLDTETLAERAAGLIEQAENDATFRPSIRDQARTRFSLPARIDALERHFAAVIDDHAVVRERAA